jgi:hypothetical protein
VGAKAGDMSGAAPAGIHVEKLPGNHDHFPVEPLLKQVHPVGEGSGKPGEISPYIEGPLRFVRCRDSERLQPFHQHATLGVEGVENGPRLPRDVPRFEEGQGGAL